MVDEVMLRMLCVLRAGCQSRSQQNTNVVLEQRKFEIHKFEHKCIVIIHNFQKISAK